MSDVLFCTESIGEEEKKVFIVRDKTPHFLRGPRFQPAKPIGKSRPALRQQSIFSLSTCDMSNLCGLRNHGSCF